MRFPPTQTNDSIKLTLRPLVRLDAHKVEGELELGRARPAVGAEVDEGVLQLPKEGGPALEHAQQVQRLVPVVLVDVEGQLVDPVRDEPCVVCGSMVMVNEWAMCVRLVAWLVGWSVGVEGRLTDAPWGINTDSTESWYLSGWIEGGSVE